MVKDYQTGQAANGVNSSRLMAVAVAVCAVIAMGFLALHVLRQPSGHEESEPKDVLPPGMFRDWPKPDLALVVSGEMQGYLQPCGCSEPQVGGLVRRYNLIQMLKKRGWPVAAVDVGDVAQPASPPQTRNSPLRLSTEQRLLKYRYSMDMLREIGYTGVGIGQYELAMQLGKINGEWSLNEKTPRTVAANLKNLDEFPGIEAFEVAKPPGSPLKLAVVGLVSKQVAEISRDPAVAFNSAGEALPPVFEKLAKAKPDLSILLFNGSPRDAEQLAESKYNQFDVILSLTEGDLGPAATGQVGKTMIVRGLGQRGKEVGVVGVYRTGKPDKPYELRYQLVDLEPRFATPEGEADNHPIMKMMERYAAEVEEKDFLHKVPKMPFVAGNPADAAKFVGSAACKKCHEPAYDVWLKSNHAHALDSLVKAKHPSKRQFDVECVVCHVTGLAFNSGYVDDAKTPHLNNVGCESCHGPGSKHVADHKNVAFQLEMNPWHAPADETEPAKKARQRRISDFCMKCHDADNDVNYDGEKRWKAIEH
jgi:hypothetical protein